MGTADHLTLSGLIAWLERQPQQGCYRFNDWCGGCLLDRYLTAVTGKPSRPDADTHWVTCGGESNYFTIAHSRPWTFGAALERARAVLLAGHGCVAR